MAQGGNPIWRRQPRRIDQSGADNGLVVLQEGGGNSLGYAQTGAGLTGVIQQSGGRALQVFQDGAMPLYINQNGLTTMPVQP